MRTIYKICPASAWREAERQGVYKGSADDLRDGYIHFSTASQVAETARKHYFGQTGLFLIAVDGSPEAVEAIGKAVAELRTKAAAIIPKANRVYHGARSRPGRRRRRAA